MASHAHTAKLNPKFDSSVRFKKSTQPCWTCQNYIFGCSWSEKGIPVEGWIATMTTYSAAKHITYNSYDILYCPQYRKEISND